MIDNERGGERGKSSGLRRTDHLFESVMWRPVAVFFGTTSNLGERQTWQPHRAEKPVCVFLCVGRGGGLD